MKLLIELAEASGLKAKIEAMFYGREDQHHGEPRGLARGAAIDAER